MAFQIVYSIGILVVPLALQASVLGYILAIVIACSIWCRDCFIGLVLLGAVANGVAGIAFLLGLAGPGYVMCLPLCLIFSTSYFFLRAHDRAVKEKREGAYRYSIAGWSAILVQILAIFAFAAVAGVESRYSAVALLVGFACGVCCVYYIVRAWLTKEPQLTMNLS
ncbi:MAG: hypothetical protein AAF604_08100 [Acidobacteriota bacterium]